MPKHRAGAGIAGKHTTIIEAAEKVVDRLRTIPETRIALGIIKRVRRNGYRKIKFSDTISGFRMKITGNLYIQEITIITPHRKDLITIADKTFNQK